MAWAIPPTFTAGVAPPAADMNKLRDDLNYLFARPTSIKRIDGSDYSTTSTSFVNVDATNMSHTIVTSGGDVLVMFQFTLDSTNSEPVNFDISEDGTRRGLDDGLVRQENNGNDTEVITVWAIFDSPSAASHTYRLMWKTDGVTATIYAGGSSGGKELHPLTFAKEL